TEPTPDPSAPPPGGPPPPSPQRVPLIEGALKFACGCVLTIGAGLLLFVTVFKDLKHVSGCVVAQLIYIVPIVIFLLFRRQPAWAFGIVFGGAAVMLLGSICGNFRWGG